MGPETPPYDRGPAVYDDPRAPPASCPPPIVVNGGIDPAPDPGATCVLTVQPSALDPVPPASHGWIDLGERAVGETVPFAVPPGTASITLVEQWVSGGPADGLVVVGNAGGTVISANAAVIGELRDPAGNVIYSDYHTSTPRDGSGELLFYESPQAVTGTITYPNTSAALAALGAGGVAPGDWSAVVSDWSYECFLASQPTPPPGLEGVLCASTSTRNDSRYHLYVLTQPMVAGSAGTIPDTGTLDVVLHIVDSPTPVIGIDAAGAVSDPRVARMVESYGAFLANAGVCLGTVTFRDAPDWARARFATGVTDTDSLPCDNLGQLATLSSVGARTLDLFLVTRIVSSGVGAVTVGLDPSIPGSASVNGTVASGAALSAENLLAGSCPAPGSSFSPAACGADFVAYLAAHESGHFLGLYHVTEFNGRNFDPISDTPHCECGPYCRITCIYAVPAGQCDQHYERCSGGRNLMFWLFDPAVSGGFLSPGQGQVVRASPLVRSP